MKTSFAPNGLLPVGLIVLCCATAAHAGPSTCQSHTDASRAQVIELYTSEGCSSCPPADQWLSSLSATPGVIALAFHVDYWDYIGWKDRFANPAYALRQRQWQARTGSRSIYTPQVLVNGEAWQRWPAALPKPGPALPEAPALMLSQTGQQVQATIRPAVASSSRPSSKLRAYWAVLEDGHKTTVRAGENDGRTLLHDHVVSVYLPLSPWPASSAQQFTLTLPDLRQGARAQRVAMVIEDAERGEPIQALSLACPAAR